MIKTTLSITLILVTLASTARASLANNDTKQFVKSNSTPMSRPKACPLGSVVLSHLQTNAGQPLSHYVTTITNRSAAFKGIQNPRNILVTWDGNAIKEALKNGKTRKAIKTLIVVAKDNYCSKISDTEWRCRCSYIAEDNNGTEIGKIHLEGGKREIVPVLNKITNKK